jgi:hypothetical protein
LVIQNLKITIFLWSIETAEDLRKNEPAIEHYWDFDLSHDVSSRLLGAPFPSREYPRKIRDVPVFSDVNIQHEDFYD